MVFTRSEASVGGVTLEVHHGGSGAPLVLLHDQDVLNQPETQQVARTLAEQFRVVAPSHPGFGGSTLPAWLDSVDDLAYVYLDWLRAEFGGEPVRMMGMGFGGWIAAEIAVRCEDALSALVLVDALGIKVSDRTTSDIADVFAIPGRQLLELTWHDPERGEQAMLMPGVGQPSLDELTVLLRNRQTAALLGWKPYMHNPKLRRRLARISVPTLVVWGESDRVVLPSYGRAYAESIPGARFEVVQAAGHFPYLEQPDELLRLVTPFLVSPPTSEFNGRGPVPTAVSVQGGAR